VIHMGLSVATQLPEQVGQALPSANPSSQVPHFLLATDVTPRDTAWSNVAACARVVAEAYAPIVGFPPKVRLTPMDQTFTAAVVHAGEGASELFLLPLSLEFDLLQREMLGRSIVEARRNHPKIAIHHDDIDPGDPLIVDCLAAQAMKALQESGADPRRTGLILAATGQGDSSSRAQSYRLMRLLWERLGLVAGEIGFLRHERPFLLSNLENCARTALDWIIIPQMLWKSEYFEYAEIILQNFQRSHPEAAHWRLADPPGNHSAVAAWLTARISRLWNEKRSREQIRRVSRYAVSRPETLPSRGRQAAVGCGIIGSVTDRTAMAGFLHGLLTQPCPDRIVVKVTWHGYATGTYTDPAALDLLLSALRAKAVIVEGHTSSRNLGGANFDWETESRQNRAWIRQQDAEYLRRTGLAEVMTRHGAQYVNVTDAFWDEDCVPAGQIDRILEQRGVTLHHPELAQYIPRVLSENAGCPMISFAKFKGPTRLSISNMFGLLPEPLRAAWHGPNITYMARVCCDLVKLYGTLFDLYGINEALYSAVRWNRKGLYRSRWGNYDLVENTGYLTASRGVVTADILASRLQGQDVTRSAFFDVVRTELGWDGAASQELLPPAIQVLFV
jgi:sirohydrochlorin ferrochelatase